MKRLNVAVCGVGHLGRIHARILAEHEDVELMCVVDPDEGRAKQVAEDFGCKAVAEPGDLPEGLDAVVIAVPTVHHAEVAVPLLERGVACLVEKPLASNLEAADRILDAAERGGAILAVGHVERFQAGVKRVREMNIEPRFIECHRLAPFSFRSTDVGVVHDLMIHDLDLVLDFVDSEVTSIDAAGGAILTAHEDVASVRLVFANGARANVTASRASLKPMRRFRLFWSEGYVSLDFTDSNGMLVRKGPRWDEERGQLQNLDAASLAARPDLLANGMIELVPLELGSEQRPLQAELDAFLANVRDGTAPLVSGHDGRNALALAERIADEIRAQAW